MRGVIRLNDPTSHGGKVVGAAPNSTVLGVAVARKGDPCVCPIKGHVRCVIAEGDPQVLIDGVPVWDSANAPAESRSGRGIKPGAVKGKAEVEAPTCPSLHPLVGR